MKKLFLSSTIVATIMLFACNKSTTSPQNPTGQSSNANTNSVAQVASNSITKNQPSNGSAAKAIATETMIPNLDGGPNDDLCIPGAAHCQGVVVIIDGFTSAFRTAIQNNTLPTFLTDETIAYLTSNADGTVNQGIYDLLIAVRGGDKHYTIVEAPMPNAQGVNAAFVIGHTGNMPTSNYEGAVVIRQQ